ncbi:PREDICTED: sphingomyelin phosphodiesterase-like isoform X2 [Vollenhovia emeryi]|uniref:sphingomyelin phosphodiesterase-like isoform X2 n=1 Tax=Vollenhovia emeryi TaxID=411798 RepID=UPI0005F46E13|nr:PREDICTED: sphingomyelin phosphodiesterase-like isoform X2 [Vollenhovia emeryi]
MQFCRLLFLALLLKVVRSEVTSYIDDTVSHFTHEINNWIKVQEESEEFQQLIHSLALPTSLQRDEWHTFIGKESKDICIVCKSILNSIIECRKQGMSAGDIRCKVIKLCTQLNLATERVCDGVITINLPTVIHIVDSKPNLTATVICGVILESKSCPLNDEEFNWTVNIDNGPPILIDPEDSNEILNIVQIPDIHYDPNYEPYGNPYCDEPTCCRKGQNDTNTSGEVAGYWGDYNNCDNPWHNVVDVLDHIRAQHQNISYVYFTGDIVDHGAWEITIEGNVKSLSKVYLQIHETFRKIPVYPILGNHETYPVNQFAPKTVTNSEINTQWLYEMIADLWISFGWLPESTRSTILQGGYYTVSPRKGFRIIALNSNVCFRYNWWLWYAPKDPYGQLQWMADTLSRAEEDGEFVHILAHIPPGDKECLSTWRREYIKVVKRFSHIIRAQFNGHTHTDELQLYYGGDDNSKINNVAWNGGSINTNQNLNSNYKLYTVDNKNYAVKDFETWIYNLTLANAKPDQRPSWYKSYSFKKEYGISDLSHDSLQAWLSRLANDKSLLNRYYRNYFKRADPALRKECDVKCMRPYMCRIIVSLGDHRTKCESCLRGCWKWGIILQI